MLTTKFKQIENIKPTGVPKLNKIKREASFNDLIFLCTCQHMDCGHKFGFGECYYLNCNCKKFVAEDLVIKVKIVMLDLFLIENPGTIFDDSPQFWLSFGKWSEK